MRNIRIVEGDITQAKVDAIVNAANPKMLGGGGVDGAIHKAAGPALLESCRKVKAVNGIRCPFGEARITEAGDLPAKYVIHTAGPIYRNEINPAAVLTSSYQKSLELAKANQCLSIAFPAISCGVYGYPHDEAARIAFKTCSQDEFSEMRIIFYLYGDAIYQTWLKIFERDQMAFQMY